MLLVAALSTNQILQKQSPTV